MYLGFLCLIRVRRRKAITPMMARIPTRHAINICRSCQYAFLRRDATKRTTMMAGLFVDELSEEPDGFTSTVGDRLGVSVMVGVASMGPSFIMLVGAGTTRLAVMVVAGSSRAANKCIAPWKRV